MSTVLRSCTRAFLTGAMLLAAPVAVAQDADEQPVQELFRTRLVYPQERGEIQLSLTTRYSEGSGRSLFETPLTFEYGLTDRWQVEVEWDTQRRRKATDEAATYGVGDVGVGTQFSFMSVARSTVHAAVGIEVTFPVASMKKEMTEGFVEYEPYLILAKDFPALGNMQVFSQVGIGFVHRARAATPAADEPAAHEFTLGAGALVPFRRTVFTAELDLSTNRWNNGGEELEIYATPGMVLRLPHHWEIGAGIPIGLTRDAARRGTVITLVYEFSVRGSDPD